MSGWRQLQVDDGSEVPAGRGGAACTALDGRRILCFGGADREPRAFDDLWLLELGADGQGHWTRVSPVLKLSRKRKLLPRSGASITYVPGPGGGPGKVYVFGGQEPASGAIFDDLLCLDTSSWELTDVTLEQQVQPQQTAQPPPPQPPQRPPGRHSHVAGLYEGRGLIIFGGAGLRGPLADVWAFQPSSDGAVDGSGTSGSWRCLSGGLAEDQGPERREMAAGCMISEAGLLVHGGRGADGGLLSDILIFDGRAGRWVLSQDTGVPRCAHTACNAAVQQHAAQQQPATSGGQGAAAAGPQPADSSGSTKAGGGGGAAPGAGNVLLFGGFDGEGVAGDLLQLTFRREQRGAGSRSLRAELRPVKAAAEGAPQPRFAHAAAVLPSTDGTSAEVVLFGGVNAEEDLSDVHIYTL
ncbi:galactose oxidase [Chlorella sorokiniana]|uniref:Galactose oxidase n=1 Tax=Chlorella sorokiniana TaxID=3076 RepID=A0A2P6TTT4_CHLSO|nr:galactose oxidase [Chlorella sorokiniana]|eukprot:PRW57469.1 galactose oxidase [Chlorella sorokiniana]